MPADYLCPSCHRTHHSEMWCATAALTTLSDLRRSFEAWISAPPYEHEVLRYDTKYAWPGAYRSITVQLAWEAWRESANNK